MQAKHAEQFRVELGQIRDFLAEWKPRIKNANIPELSALLDQIGQANAKAYTYIPKLAMAHQ